MYDSLFQEIDRELDWLVLTHDRTTAGNIKKILKELQAKLNAPAVTPKPDPGILVDVTAGAILVEDLPVPETPAKPRTRK